MLTRPLPGTRPGWELCALGADTLLRIHPATGLVVRSPVPRVGDGQVSLVPLRRGVLLRRVGPGPGYLVPDDGRTVVLSPELAGDGPVLPGPDQDHVWTVRQQGGAEVALVDVGTRRTRVVVPVPIGPQLPHGMLSPDAGTVALFVVPDPTEPMRTPRIGLALVGLRSGIRRSVDVDLTGVAGDGSLAWSPDGRWLYCVDTTTGLAAVEVSSGAISLLDPSLPPVSQLAIRIGS